MRLYLENNAGMYKVAYVIKSVGKNIKFGREEGNVKAVGKNVGKGQTR